MCVCVHVSRIPWMWPKKWHQGSLAPEPGIFTWSCSLAPSSAEALMLYSRGLSFSQWTHLAAAFVELSSKILDLFFLVSSCCEKQLAGSCSRALLPPAWRSSVFWLLRGENSCPLGEGSVSWINNVEKGTLNSCWFGGEVVSLTSLRKAKILEGWKKVWILWQVNCLWE